MNRTARILRFEDRLEKRGAGSFRAGSLLEYERMLLAEERHETPKRQWLQRPHPHLAGVAVFHGVARPEYTAVRVMFIWREN